MPMPGAHSPGVTWCGILSPAHSLPDNHRLRASSGRRTALYMQHILNTCHLGTLSLSSTHRGDDTNKLLNTNGCSFPGARYVQCL